MTQSDDEKPVDPASLRRPWTEGPDEDAPEESWLSVGDDELLHRVETLPPDEDVDDRLIEIVQSSRHFFIRQEAAKRVRDRSRLFPFEDDRHIGQILVRYLTRREDVTYLERLVASSHHVEVRAAAQVQLAQLWGRLGGPTGGAEGSEAPPPPVFEEAVRPPELRESTSPSVADASRDEEIEIEVDSVEAFALAPAAEPASKPSPPPVAPAAPEPEAATVEVGEPAASQGPAGADAGGTDDGVDGSLLGWAVHFLVEQVWSHLDTQGARGLLLRTHAELLPVHPELAFFRVEDDAHVHVDLTEGARLPREAVPGVAAWMTAFLSATRSTSPALEEVDVRHSTRLMADALEQVGFYEAFRAAEDD